MSRVVEATRRMVGDSVLRMKVMKLLFVKRRLTSSGCVEWTGRVSYNGYGLISVCGGSFRTHRLSWIFANAQTVPEGKEICHHCDNPPCMNPEHLYAGTRKENISDLKIRGGENLSGIAARKISDPQVLEIIERFANGETRRQLAAAYDVDYSSITRVLSGRRGVAQPASGGAHECYTGFDKGAPDAIKDRNGEVVLACCKKCGLGEVELDDNPICTGGRQSTSIRGGQ